ncbi:MAG: hypothetical protein Greene041679_662 [Parcubacteria group bacterium Greene0416_79]|nr:MAG: hypothetical protein Greene041679_662 [Parcubacteria group bacterium Greene0416_79]
MLFWLARGAFFVPTPRRVVPRVILMLNLRKGEKATDLGSSDGRLVIALAQAGGIAHGFEHNPLLVWRSRQSIKKEGLTETAFVHWRNFWKADLSSFDAVVVYGIPYIMRRLEKKLRAELRPGARVVSCSFPFPTWKPVVQEKAIYLYVK